MDRSHLKELYPTFFLSLINYKVVRKKKNTQVRHFHPALFPYSQTPVSRRRNSNADFHPFLPASGQAVAFTDISDTKSPCLSVLSSLPLVFQMRRHPARCQRQEHVGDDARLLGEDAQRTERQNHSHHCVLAWHFFIKPVFVESTSSLARKKEKEHQSLLFEGVKYVF